MNIKITLSTAYTEELADPISQEYKDLSTTLISVYKKELIEIQIYYDVNYEIKGVTFTGGSDGTNAVLTVEFTSDETDINAAILKGFLSFVINAAIARGSFLNIGEDKTVEITEGKNTSLNHYLTQCVPNQESSNMIDVLTRSVFKILIKLFWAIFEACF